MSTTVEDSSPTPAVVSAKGLASSFDSGVQLTAGWSISREVPLLGGAAACGRPPPQAVKNLSEGVTKPTGQEESQGH